MRENDRQGGWGRGWREFIYWMLRVEWKELSEFGGRMDTSLFTGYLIPSGGFDIHCTRCLNSVGMTADGRFELAVRIVRIGNRWRCRRRPRRNASERASCGSELCYFLLLARRRDRSGCFYRMHSHMIFRRRADCRDDGLQEMGAFPLCPKAARHRQGQINNSKARDAQGYLN